MENTMVWFDIPVKDLSRAIKFYSSILQIEMHMMENGPNNNKMAFFPFEPGAASGALVQSNETTPSDQGTVVYLNAGSDLSKALNRIEAAGGEVLQQKTDIGDHGFIAYFKDTEGNRLALHSMK